MFFLFAISAISISIGSAHFMDLIDADIAIVYSWMLFFLAGLGPLSNGSMQHRLTMDVIFIWTAWTFLSDWVIPLSPTALSIETAIFTVLAAWVYFRPYKHLSTRAHPENVCIAFYGGPNAPTLSRWASIIGSPFASVAISGGGVAVRPSLFRGKMVQTTTAALEAKGYVFIDTCVPYSPEIHGKLMEVVGTKTGYGLFRFKCMQNLTPILDCLGHEWVPSIPILPSLYFDQCVRNAK